MAKQSIYIVFSLLAIAVTHACHPRPTTPIPGPTPTVGTHPKFTTTPKPLPKDVAEIMDTMNEEKTGSNEAAEKIKKALEVGETVTEMIEAFTEELPFVKVIGSVFSLISNAIESEMIMKELEKIFDVMQQQFAIVDNKLDMLKWQLNDMLHEMSKTLFNVILDEQYDQILKIQDAKQRFQDKSDETTLQDLRTVCLKSGPSGVIDVLTSMITSAQPSVICRTIEYNSKEWASKSQQISQHFMQAMLMQQVCLGVQINFKDKGRPTAEDREFFANYSSAQFRRTTDAMKTIADMIDREWSTNQLDADIAKMVNENFGRSMQDVANSVYNLLKSKYVYNFGVFAHKVTDSQSTTPPTQTSQESRVYKDAQHKIVVVVNWGKTQNPNAANLRGLASNAINSLQCSWDNTGRWKPKLDIVPEIQKQFQKAIQRFSSGAYNVIYFVVSAPKIDHGQANDAQANTYTSTTENCNYKETKCHLVGRLDDFDCRNVNTPFAYYAVFGY